MHKKLLAILPPLLIFLVFLGKLNEFFLFASFIFFVFLGFPAFSYSLLSLIINPREELWINLFLTFEWGFFLVLEVISLPKGPYLFFPDYCFSC